MSITLTAGKASKERSMSQNNEMVTFILRNVFSGEIVTQVRAPRNSDDSIIKAKAIQNAKLLGESVAEIYSALVKIAPEYQK